MRSLIGLPSLYLDQPCLSDNHNILVVTNFGGNRSYASALLILCLWADCAYVGLGSLGYAHTTVLTLRFTGDSKSPMPPPVGGILDTPIVTFHSRIPEDLSLRIDGPWCSRDDTFLTLGTGGPGSRLQVDKAPLGTYS